MMFLALLVFGALAGLGVRRLSDARSGDPREPCRDGMALALLVVGIDHLITPERYIPMIESFMPAPALVVLVTGLVEIAGAAGLLIPSLRRRASIAIAVYLLAVFPANLANALLGLTAEGLPVSQNYYWFRLALQPLFIWWALVAGRILPLPSPWRRGI